MGQLTGLQQGTAFDDTFAADVTLEVTDSFDLYVADAAIASARIETFSGDDRVTAQVTVMHLSGYPTATGVLNSAIALGEGGDRLEVFATANGVFSAVYGVRFSSLQGGDGDDSFTITARGFFVQSWPAAGSNSRGLANSTLDGGNGNNTITISSITETAPRFSQRYAISSGLLSGSIQVGTGHDTISITGFAQSAGTYYPVGSGGGAGAESTGIRDGAIATSGGNDLVNITATAEGAGFARTRAYGIRESSVHTGDGDDTLSAIARGYSTDYYAGTSASYGIYQSVVDSSKGDDTIRASVFASGHPFSTSSGPTGYALSDSTVLGGDGNDEIILTVETIAGSQRFGATIGAGYGVWRAGVQGGQGNDTIRVNVLTTASAYAGGNSLAYGVDQSSITGGDGDDLVTILSGAQGFSYVASGAPEGTRATSYGLSDSTLGGGDGDDTLQIEVWAQAQADISSFSYEATAYGVYKAEVLGDRGNDTIDISATTTGFYEFGGKGYAYGVLQGRVEGGDGQDDITISGSASTKGTEYGYGIVEGYGVVNSSVNGGSGDDRITLSGTTFAIQDALISGGSGDDTFQVGIGQGTLDGGAGHDLAILDFLDLQTMTVTTLGNNSLRIVGTQDGAGTAASWTQTLWNIERFQVGSSVFYTAADLVSFWQTGA
ncbi:MAG: hypothetical protein Fur0046_25490 [Cyanobacteria bacterium J069]|nr:MAG: hypothetical protein D6742_05325 [Cyanobacteria bacterium J069]